LSIDVQNEKENRPMIETLALSKRFGPTVALHEVDLKVYGGQIIGLIGENGSGKSTISSIIAGMLPATSGSMRYKGDPHAPRTMIEAGDVGIGMIVQEQGYVAGISIARNIFLGVEKRFRKVGFISRKAMNKEAASVLQSIGLGNIDPGMLIDDLNIQDRKLIELARVIANNPDILIVDETTTALSQHGRDITYSTMRKMRDEGKAVIFISHDIDELLGICDSLAILRDGILVSRLEQSEFDTSKIKSLMVGRDMDGKYYREDFGQPVSDEVVLRADRVTSAGGLLMNFSMELRKGEILGIGGLSHCGMHELGRVLFGDEKLLTGSVTHVSSGEQVVSSRKALKLSMGYVSKDRDKEALVLTASIRDNIASAGLDKVNSGPLIFPAREKEYVLTQVKNLSIKCASIEQNVQYLSGGNKQKVVFGKWIGRDCDILILDCPTRGVDIGVKAAMYQLMEDMKRSGKSIVMISEELPELIGMTDRLIILKDGSEAGVFQRSPDLTEQEIIDYMI